MKKKILLFAAVAIIAAVNIEISSTTTETKKIGNIDISIVNYKLVVG